jgi:superfamily II DNA or RNA helicase
MAMGSGKTLTTIEFIKHIQLKRVLIIAPKTILENVWYPELTKYIKNDKIKIYTTTYHSLHKQPTHMFDLIIADESHYLKNPRTRRVKSLFSLSYKFIVFLTGTPIINHAGDVYTYFRSIYPNTYKYSINRPTFKIPYYWDWIKEFHYTKLNKFNGIDIGRLKPYKKYLLSSIVSSMSYQYLKQPENTIQIIQVSTPHKLTKEQEVEQHKAEMMLDEFRYQNQVIVVQYRKTAQFLYKMLKTTQKTQVITGETKDRTIQPDTQTLIITLGTGTEGIDLTMFNQMYILTPNWSPALLDQLTARIWRGDKENFNKPVYLVVTNHETDRIRIGALKKKHQVVKTIGEGGGM